MNKRNIEAIYPLGPLQRAMLFHRQESESVDTGFLQVRFTLRGRLDVSAFEDAWQQIVRHHPALRMSVHTPNQEQPLGVVWRSVDIPWTHEDARSLSNTEPNQRIEAYCLRDRRQQLDLSKAPVMRLARIQSDDDQHHIIWTCHHILLDGWSASVVLQQVLATYNAIRSGADPTVSPRSPSFKDYLAWLKQQDETAAESFWRQKLQGFRAPTSLRLGSPDGNGQGSRADYDQKVVSLNEALSTRLQELSTSSKTTPNALLQAAWALLLGRLSGSDDVMFGTTVSGRSAAIPGIESMVGFFTNAVPVRVRIDAQSLSIVHWLQQLRDEQFEMQAHEHVPLSDVQAWSEVPGYQRLFDSLLVFENFPWKNLRDRGATAKTDLELSDYRSGMTSTYPLTIVVSPGDRWSIHAIFGNP